MSLRRTADTYPFSNDLQWNCEKLDGIIMCQWSLRLIARIGHKALRHRAKYKPLHLEANLLRPTGLRSLGSPPRLPHLDLYPLMHKGGIGDETSSSCKHIDMWSEGALILYGSVKGHLSRVSQQSWQSSIVGASRAFLIILLLRQGYKSLSGWGLGIGTWAQLTYRLRRSSPGRGPAWTVDDCAVPDVDGGSFTLVL